MIKTPIYELNQPQGNDVVDIEVLNENARKIDNILNFKIDSSKKSDSVTLGSSDSVATSKAVKVAYDKGVEALGKASGNEASLTDMSRLARARDARSEGWKTPQWYIDNGFKNQNLLELNIQSNVGLSGGIMCHVLSIIPWHDTSGAITQLITVIDGNTYKRWSTNGSTWSPTVRLLDEKDTKVIQDGGASYDLNNAVESSIVRSVSFLNYPVGLVADAQGICETTKYTNGWVRQVFISPHASYTCERIEANGVWLPWYVNFNSDNYGSILWTPGLTLEAVHGNKILHGGGTTTIPINVFPVGTQITFINMEGIFNFVPSAGVTLYSKDSKRTIDGPHSSATLIQLGYNIWTLIGALK